MPVQTSKIDFLRKQLTAKTQTRFAESSILDV